MDRENPIETLNLEEAIRKATHAEQRGHEFYKAQAEAAKNPLTKALLEELAQDELRHCMWFRELGREVAGEPDPSTEAGCATLEERLKAVFETMDEAVKANPDRDQEEVLKEAVQLEKESYATYDNLYKDSTGKTKEFFDRMRREEYEHLVALENILMYIARTGMWFDIEESKRWNWMNL